MLGDIILKWGGAEVTPMDLYRDMFHLGTNEIQNRDEPPGSFKANPIAYWKNDTSQKGHYRIMFDDTFEETLLELQEADFSILNGITYYGRKNVQAKASKMYALIFDLDGVTDSTLNAFLSGAIVGDAYPVPNYIVLSGHGVHLYYLLEYGVPLYPNIKLQLKNLKYALTEKIWNRYTSEAIIPQMQGINQGFRVVGGRTKEDSPIRKTVAYRLNLHPFNLEQLCQYVPEEYWIDETKLWKEGKCTLQEAKQRYPEWYEKVIVNGDKTPKLWDIKGKVNGENPYALYDWWKRQIHIGTTYHHRYFAIMCLAIYGAKNEKPFDEVEKDAYDLIPFMNSINPDAPFTKEDCDSALECYDLRYAKFPIKDIEKITGITIERNKRNGRRQKQHVKIMNAIRDVVYEDGTWRNTEGRPKGSGTAKEKVANYRLEHPEQSVTDVARALNLSRTTVYKWWDGEEKATERQKSVTVRPEQKRTVEKPELDVELRNEILKMLLKMPDDERAAFLSELDSAK